MRSIIAQSAGVSVRATSPDIHTDTTKVRANCLCITPTKPSINATGTNTAESTKTIDITGAIISSMALMVASLTLKFGSSCKIRSTFSITIIASSTTIPIAKIRAKSVIKFTENPIT